MVQINSTLESWDDLAAVLSVAKSKSIRAAAEKMGVAHTTLARRIEAAEAALGIVIFVRSTNGYALTDVGERMLPHIARMAEEAESLRRELAGVDTSPSGTVKVTLPPALLKYCLAPTLPRFVAKFPHINLDFDTRYSFSNLDRHEADIAVRYQSEPEPHLFGTRVGTSLEFAYATSDVIAQVQAGQKPQLIGWARNEAFRKRAAALELAAHDIGFVCVDLHGQVALAESGIGIAILPSIVGDKCKTLERLNTDLCVKTDEVWVLVHADLRRSARIRSVAEFLGQELRHAL